MENIKIKSTVYPDKQISFNEWAGEFRVSVACNTSKLTDKANEMMSLWDEKRRVKHMKKLILAL
jgi:hypothetical protein